MNIKIIVNINIENNNLVKNQVSLKKLTFKESYDKLRLNKLNKNIENNNLVKNQVSLKKPTFKESYDKLRLNKLKKNIYKKVYI